jgi:hypothetical protein
MDSMRRKLISMLTPRERSISGNAPLSFRAKAGNIKSLKQYGKCVQNGTPTPDAPVDIVCNNGVLKVRHQSGLPLGYTLLEYIESNTNIPLGFYTNQNSEIEAKWYKDDAGAQYVYKASSGSASTNNTTAYMAEGGGNWRFGNQTISIQAPLNTDIISIQNRDGIWFNNEQQGVYTDVNDFTGNVEFMALGVPTGDNPMIRLSYIKHRQNGVLLGHYVPCVAQDNSIGLYDLIGGVFYTNAAATITAGNTVSDPVEVYADGTVETIEDTIGNTATAEMLLKVGDYQDVQEIISGDVTRKVGVKVLDGTENWRKTSSSIKYCSLTKTDTTGFPNAITTASNVICTHAVGTAYDVQGHCSFGGNNFNFNYKDSANDLEDFKQFLADQYAAGTPVIIVYPLAEPTTESVTPQSLRTRSGNNTIEVDSNVDPVEIEVKYRN